MITVITYDYGNYYAISHCFQKVITHITVCLPLAYMRERYKYIYAYITSRAYIPTVIK